MSRCQGHSDKAVLTSTAAPHFCFWYDAFPSALSFSASARDSARNSAGFDIGAAAPLLGLCRCLLCFCPRMYDSSLTAEGGLPQQEESDVTHVALSREAQVPNPGTDAGAETLQCLFAPRGSFTDTCKVRGRIILSPLRMIVCFYDKVTLPRLHVSLQWATSCGVSLRRNGWDLDSFHTKACSFSRCLAFRHQLLRTQHISKITMYIDWMLKGKKSMQLLLWPHYRRI